MALRLLNPGINPLGEFDALDAEALLVKGGEVATLKSITATAATDEAAQDVFDGYTVSSGSVVKRAVATRTLSGTVRPLFLIDEGSSAVVNGQSVGYGTILGSVIGGTAGTQTTGTVVGPHTASGSGKWTLWDKQGMYAVSLDACDTTASTGLQPTNTTLDTASQLYATSQGLLTPTSGSAFDSTALLGRFVDFTDLGSLVNTPNRLTQALNSPSGTGTATTLSKFQFAVFNFNPQY